MPDDDRLLFSPISLGNVRVRNRVVVTAHGASETFRNPLLPAEPYIEYLRRRAAGGVGLIIAQALYVNPAGLYADEFTDRHARLAEAVKTEGATLMLQLVHLGATFRSDADVRRPALWGFSSTVTDRGEAVHTMTDDEIEMMIDGYGRIARMSVQAGFDGCEIHGAHGYLGQQSLSPWLNRRDDKWGQDRTLFLRRVVDVVRREIGPDRILGYRTATDDLRAFLGDGLGSTGLVDAVARITATGEIDVINTTVGHGGKSYAQAIPSYRHTEAVNMPKARAFKDALGGTIPMIGVGRIVSVGAAEKLLQAGDCDLVAMTRAHITDPDLVRKAQHGQAHRIRPCVGALVCNSRKLAGFSEISCLHNPEVLREKELGIVPTTTPRRVLIIGAGPAGLKCAEIAAKRGHSVRIVDAGARAGGRLRMIEQTAASDLASAVDHLVTELSELGVRVELNVMVDQAMLETIAPEYVVLASGGQERLDGRALPWEPQGDVVTGIQALTGQVARDVVVFDALGANDGALVAETLAGRGHQVTLVTPYEIVMPYGGISHRMETPDILRRRLRGVHTDAVVGLFDGVTATIVRVDDGETVAEIPAGTIVAIIAPEPRLELVAAIEALQLPYTIIGDASAPRAAVDAFRDGQEAAMKI